MAITFKSKGFLCHTKQLGLNVRLSNQMEKILLTLYRNKNRDLSISELARIIIGAKAFIERLVSLSSL